MCSSNNPFFFLRAVRNYCVYFLSCCSWRRWPSTLLSCGRVKINPDHGDETKGNICCLPVVLSLQEVELLLDAINRLADCQLERGRLWTLERNKFKKSSPDFTKKFQGGKSMINQALIDQTMKSCKIKSSFSLSITSYALF